MNTFCWRDQEQNTQDEQKVMLDAAQLVNPSNQR